MYSLFCCKKRAKRRNTNTSYKVAALIALLDGSPARTERALQSGLINTVSDIRARSELQLMLDELTATDDYLFTVTPDRVNQLINHARFICYNQRSICFFKSSAAVHFDCFFDADNNIVTAQPRLAVRVML